MTLSMLSHETPAAELAPSDGRETIRCEGCDRTIVHGNSVVLLDLCQACEDLAVACEDCDP